MDKRIKTVWILSISAIVLIFLGQVYWLHNQYLYSMEEGIGRLKEDCSAAILQEYAMRDNAMRVSQKEKAKVKDQDSLIFKVYMSERQKRSYSNTYVRIVFSNGTKQHQRIMNGIDAKQGLELLDRYHVSRYRKTVTDTINSTLKRKGYEGIMNVRIIRSNSLYLTPKYSVTGGLFKKVQVLYSSNPLGYEVLSFDISVPINMIVANMAWQLAGSMVLIIFLTLSFVYQIKTIIIQKRIDALRREFMKNMIMEMKQPAEEGQNADETVKIGDTTFIYSMNELQYGDQRVMLTSRQAEILRMLVSDVNVVVPRSEILNEVWGDDSYANSLALNVQITYLRRALKADHSLSIEAIIKKGYVLHDYSCI